MPKVFGAHEEQLFLHVVKEDLKHSLIEIQLVNEAGEHIVTLFSVDKDGKFILHEVPVELLELADIPFQNNEVDKSGFPIFIKSYNPET